ncbi:MAG: antitoxin VbhA family protein [Fusobacteria bacterium]|nr:antitoxin VbhA family protein [Fusobacteriota bacterium]
MKLIKEYGIILDIINGKFTQGEMFVIKKEDIELAVARVKASFEIEGLDISKNHLKILEKVAAGKLDSNNLISKYTKRIHKLNSYGN